ncbi:hypothetical protein AB0A71_26335, partial [Kitasatospora aureofaciens]|uniref:hypothetical protein n=1 Tax=Kitasatospora aureofaciens TaxID=1894 RepID=UPI0033D744D8
SAALAAEARALGCRVVAADPAYALPLPEVAARALGGRRIASEVRRVSGGDGRTRGVLVLRAVGRHPRRRPSSRL